MTIESKNQIIANCYFETFENAIDKQRRISLPKIWRNNNGVTEFILLAGRKNILQLMPLDAFQEMLVDLKKISYADHDAGIALAKIGSQAQKIECDKQGRFKINSDLLAYARLSDKACLIGAVTTIQIWNPDAWARQQVDSEECLDTMQSLQEKFK